MTNPSTGFGARLGGLLGIARTLLACMIVLASPGALAAGKTVLVIGPHEDDEILLAGGRIRDALLSGDAVKVILVTNGDASGTATGYAREAESVAAALSLGLTEQDVVFMGYGDGSLLDIHRMASSSQVVRSFAGQTATYGNRGLGGMEWHRYRTGVAAPYSRDALLGDFQDLFQYFQPDEIYTVSTFDTHTDHQATALFVAEALVRLKVAGARFPARLYQGFVWAPTTGNWPDTTGGGGCAGTTPHVEPRWSRHPPLEWNQALRFPVPAEMQAPDAASDSKCAAIGLFPSQVTSFLLSFARKDEVFWLNDFGLNMALTATVTVSSENRTEGQPGTKAVDGVIDGDGNVPTAQWVTANELGGGWIQLDWPASIRVAQVNLHDRLSPSENVLGGLLTFSDGTSVAVGALPPDGRPLNVTFPARDVTWIRFTVTSAQGTATGLSEIQVLGKPSTVTEGVAPNLLSGPSPSTASISASESVSLSVAASDVDGDALQYRWTADGGTVVGTGPSALFTPPEVTATTVFTLVSEITDGRGGRVANAAFVTVAPATAPPPPPPATGNLLRQPNAIGASPWVNWGPIATTLGFALAPDGTQTASRAVAGTAGGHALVQPGVAVSAGTSYVFSFYARSNGGTAASYSVHDGTHGSDIVSATSYVSRIDGASWTLISVPFTTPPGCTSINVYPVRDSGVPVDVLLWGASLVATSTPASADSISIAPASISGGGAATGTIVLASAAPASGLVVSLSSSDPAAASVPGSVTVPGGASSATFAVNAGAVTTTTSAVITAVIRGASYTAGVAVSPAPPATGNLLRSPNAIGTSPWVNWGGVTTTPNFAPAPDGTQTATRAVAALPGGHALAQPGVAVAPGTSYVFSFFAKNNGGLAASYSVHDNTHASDIVSATSYVSRIDGTSWTLISVPFTTPAGCTSINVYPVRDSGIPVDVLLWGASLVTGSASPVTGTLSLASASVTGGASLNGTLRLASAAGAAGVTVLLSSSDPAVASVPGSATIPAGATSADFAISTAVVLADATASITAAFPGGPAVASLLVIPAPAGVSSLSLSPSSVIGGSSVQGLVTLGAAAGAPGTTVQLSSSVPSAVGFPVLVAVPAGATSVPFVLSTAVVSTSTPVIVTATAGGTSATGSVTLLPLGVSSLSVSPASILGGSSGTGTITLNGAAPFGGATLALSSSHPAAIVPPSVTIPSGSSAGTFSFTTTPVAAPTAVVLSATLGATAASASLTVATPALATLVLSGTSVVAGGAVVGTVTLSAAAPAGGTVVALASSNPAGASVPANVVVAPGTTSATFPIAAQPLVTATSTTISATAGGVTRSAALAVRVLTLSASPTTLTGGSATTGTVRLSASVGTPTVVTLRTSTGTLASPPASVVIAAGATSSSFPIATSPVPSTTSVNVIASHGSASRTLTLSLRAATASSVTLSPRTVVGGTQATGTVTLSGAAPPGGTTVTIASSRTSVATVPPVVVVPAGSRTATFPVTALRVTASSTSSISANSGGVTRSATLTVTP